MKKIFFLLFAYLLITQSVIGQTSMQNLVQEGISKAYNMNFTDAEKIYNKIIDLYPEQPQGYYRIAQLHFWIFLGTRDPGEYYVFLKFADLAQKKIDKILVSDEQNARINYLAGNLASFKAMAYATNNATVDAIWASKKAVDYFETTLEINSKFYDAYLGLGLFDYAMSFVPDFLRWAVNLTGLTSNKERGLRYIKLAFNKGNEKTEAAFHLAKIYTDYLADYDSAYYYLNYLVEKYPKNTLFNYQYATTLIKAHRLDKATSYLNTVVRLDNSKIPQVTSLAHYRLGEIYFKKNRFNRALREYKTFLDSTKELSFNGIASFNIAICCKMLGNVDEFKEYMALAGSGNKDVYEDAYAKIKSEEYLADGISNNELKIIRMKNNLDSGNYKLVHDSLKLMMPLIKKQELLALALTYFSESALHLQNYTEAVNSAVEIQSLILDNEKWVIPNSYLIMAKSNYYEGNKENAEQYLEEAEDNNDYDFKDGLQAQIESLKRKIALMKNSHALDPK